MENELIFIPCDIHSDREAVKLDINEKGTVRFLCWSCLGKLWGLNNVELWRDTIGTESL